MHRPVREQGVVPLAILAVGFLVTSLVGVVITTNDTARSFALKSFARIAIEGNTKDEQKISKEERKSVADERREAARERAQSAKEKSETLVQDTGGRPCREGGCEIEDITLKEGTVDAGRLGYQYSEEEVAGFYKAPDGKYYPVGQEAGGPTDTQLNELVETVTEQKEEERRAAEPPAPVEPDVPVQPVAPIIPPVQPVVPVPPPIVDVNTRQVGEIWYEMDPATRKIIKYTMTDAGVLVDRNVETIVDKTVGRVNTTTIIKDAETNQIAYSESAPNRENLWDTVVNWFGNVNKNSQIVEETWIEQNPQGEYVRMIRDANNTVKTDPDFEASVDTTVGRVNTTTIVKDATTGQIVHSESVPNQKPLWESIVGWFESNDRENERREGEVKYGVDPATGEVIKQVRARNGVYITDNTFEGTSQTTVGRVNTTTIVKDAETNQIVHSESVPNQKPLWQGIADWFSRVDKNSKIVEDTWIEQNPQGEYVRMIRDANNSVKVDPTFEADVDTTVGRVNTTTIVKDSETGQIVHSESVPNQKPLWQGIADWFKREDKDSKTIEETWIEQNPQTGEYERWIRDANNFVRKDPTFEADIDTTRGRVNTTTIVKDSETGEIIESESEPNEKTAWETIEDIGEWFGNINKNSQTVEDTWIEQNPQGEYVRMIRDANNSVKVDPTFEADVDTTVGRVNTTTIVKDSETGEIVHSESKPNEKTAWESISGWFESNARENARRAGEVEYRATSGSLPGGEATYEKWVRDEHGSYLRDDSFIGVGQTTVGRENTTTIVKDAETNEIVDVESKPNAKPLYQIIVDFFSNLVK